MWTCKSCFATYAESHSVCPACGFSETRVSAGRASPQHVDGELHELDAERIRRRRAYEPGQRYARTLEELIEFGKSKGYAKPEQWARHVWDARQAKRA